LDNEQVVDLAAEVLHIDGDLMARHKVFTRTQLIAVLAPKLYGRDPRELDHIVDRVLAGSAVVPLIGAGALHEQAYATVEVLATEQAIAAAVERLATAPGPAIPTADLDTAIEAKEDEIGHFLTPGQVDAIRAVCSSERSVEVIVGVAGAGKTTALDAAASALEVDGYRVIGTSTSGQAARTLGNEAHIESRTIASLLWRIDHDRIGLDDCTVVVIDEAAMTADADLLRLITSVERARAKVVLVGDPRQLSAIGPGGAVASLLDRHPELLTTLDRNVRQRDPAERAALAELRHGSVGRAVDWYLARGRTSLSTNRTEALAGMVHAWAADIDAGHDTALLARRRDDVRDLNRLARDLSRDLGRVSGRDLWAPGGRPYAKGDQIVVLAPLPDHGLVTSKRLTVIAVDVRTSRLAAETKDGRSVVLDRTAIDADHLDHGYAVTVHRAQGATYDRAHVLAAGGGRELAYIAMSRARHGTTLHAVADGVDQARHDLALDWTNEQQQRWISDAATPARPTEGDLRRQLTALAADLQNLHTGAGRWERTPEGEAARRLNDLRAQFGAERSRAAALGSPRSERRAASRAADRLLPELASATAVWDAVGRPAADDLQAGIKIVEQSLEAIEIDALRRQLAAVVSPTPDGLSIDASGRRERVPAHRTDQGLGL
jgi:hypothetical protein